MLVYELGGGDISSFPSHNMLGRLTNIFYAHIYLNFQLAPRHPHASILIKGPLLKIL